MEISLNQEEIYQAILDSIENQNIPLVGRDVSIRLTAGRGANGHSAQIVIATPGSSTTSEATGDENPEVITPDTEPAIDFDD